MKARIAAALLLIQPLYIVCELIVAATVAAPYSLRDNMISDLGAVSCTQIAYPAGPVEVCSPWNPCSTAHSSRSAWRWPSEPCSCPARGAPEVSAWPPSAAGSSRV
ncbi:hypothetical protein GCM10025883_39960 [Mobilicoccus caccae]|uniref:Uncharacterized protein n=1 Tax=Mobilicoccus caccae TaxID=1859295 RepID=A0ABQ6IWG6_9MICO|nr:hypothetical protein GCM10025883_39960 [Mobilicoccus caccae]